MTKSIGILGAGAWGTALAHIISSQGHPAILWARRPEIADGIIKDHQNQTYLPGIPLSPSLKATSNIADLKDSQLLLVATPTQTLRAILRALKPILAEEIPLVLCCKGIELKTGLLVSQITAEEFPNWPLAILSGPTFAKEVSTGLPTAVTLACTDSDIGRTIVETIGSRTFRPYLSTDIIGSEVCGALKNVLAIACGIVEGRDLGNNARAALMTRGMAEIGRLVVHLGGRIETLMGLSGIGDIVLTCTSQQSRNMSLGFEIGQGKSLSEILSSRHSVAEGVTTVQAVIELAQRLQIDMPICQAVYEILHRNAVIDITIANLMARPFKSELL